MDTVTRPAPIGEVRHGRYYDNAEVAAYRMAHGVSQDELARTLKKQQSYVSSYENAKLPEIIQAKTVVEILDAVDMIAKRRGAMVEDGFARLAAIRADEVLPPVRRGRKAGVSRAREVVERVG
jgi:predicted transcriptional regulator